MFNADRQKSKSSRAIAAEKALIKQIEIHDKELGKVQALVYFGITENGISVGTASDVATMKKIPASKWLAALERSKDFFSRFAVLKVMNGLGSGENCQCENCKKKAKGGSK